MIIDEGEKIHIVERRYFSDDIRRHFIGEVLRSTENAIRIKGKTWVMDVRSGKWTCKPEARERVISLNERLTITILPYNADLASIDYTDDPVKGLSVTDGKTFTIDVAEFTLLR